MIAGSRPLSHLKLVQVEVIEPVFADESLSFDKAAIDEVLGFLEALGTDGMLTNLVSEQVGLVEFDGFRVNRRPAAAACDGQRIDEELPGIVARLASGDLPVHYDELTVGTQVDQIQCGRDRRACQRKIQWQLGKVRGTGREPGKKGLLPGEVLEAAGDRRIDHILLLRGDVQPVLMLVERAVLVSSCSLRLARLAVPPGSREGKLPAGEVMGGGAERCRVDGSP